MTRIAPVTLSSNQKVFWFDAGNMDIKDTDQVVVDTAYGKELAQMAGDVFEMTPEQMKNFKNELKPVLRIATVDDLYTFSENEQLADEALEEFRKIIAKQKKEMRPISVSFSLDRAKAVFCYEAEGRIDFREMVKTLARKFHARIEMRQITARERACATGGFGICGQEMCCARMGCGFSHVSIRMAKEQGLSLNQQKISGCCGRLMCCLKYEFEEYKEFNKRAPKINARIDTPEGEARVSGLDMVHESVSLKIEPSANDSEKSKGDHSNSKGESHEIKRPKIVNVPLDSFDKPSEEGKRPTSVGKEAWEKAIAPPEIKLESSGYFGNAEKKFTKDSALGDGKAHRANTANRKNATGSVSMLEDSASDEGDKQKRRRRRRRRRGGAGVGGNAGANGTGNDGQRGANGGTRNGGRKDAKGTRGGASSGNGASGAHGGASSGKRSGATDGRRRRRRSVTVSADGKKTTKTSNSASSRANDAGDASNNTGNRAGGSGGASNNTSGRAGSADGKNHTGNASNNTSDRAGGLGNAGNRTNGAKTKGRANSSRSNSDRANGSGANKGNSNATPKKRTNVRPGQKSSLLSGNHDSK